MSKVELIGKVAKFPKEVKASDAYAFMESIKVPKNKIWYILVRRQDDTLQTVKYNRFAGVDLGKMVENLKDHYLRDDSMVEYTEQIGAMVVVGEDKFLSIKNIPTIEIGGEKMVSRITKDIIALLAD